MALFILIRSLMDLKSHVFIKAQGQRILFIHSQLVDEIHFFSIFQQFFAKAFSSFFTRHEQHFQFLPVNPHKADRKFVFIFHNNKMGYFL